MMTDMAVFEEKAPEVLADLARHVETELIKPCNVKNPALKGRDAVNVF